MKMDNRNKVFFKLYIDGKLDIEKTADKHMIKPKTIKWIIKNYARKSNDPTEIIRYNQKLVLEKTNLNKEQLKNIYDIVIKYNWNIPSDINKELNISYYDIYICAKLYDLFFVKSKSDIIYDNKNNIFDDNEIRIIAKNTISLYTKEKLINIELSKEEFCKQKNLSISFFYDISRLIAVSDKDLYEEYQKLNILVEEKRANDTEDKIYYLIDCLQNGKIDQGINRKYDSIDFEIDFKNDANNISKATDKLYQQKKITVNELRLIKSFIKKIGFDRFVLGKNINTYPVFCEKDIESAVNSYQEIGCLRDDLGYPIKGTGTIISYTENKEVIDYLNDNNLTLNHINFHAGISRIAAGISLKNKQKKLI